MRPRPRSRRGMTLIEMMVVVLLVALFFGLIVPALEDNRGGCSRGCQCQNNMRQIGLALLNFSSSRNSFPNAGTFYDNPSVHGGDPAKSNIYRSMLNPDSIPDGSEPWLYSWVVEILPFLDQPDEANFWDKTAPYDRTPTTIAGQPPNGLLSKTELGVLRCPSDRTTVTGQGNLSYVVNGGFARWYPMPVGWSGGPRDGTPHDGDMLRWSPGDDWKENLAVGKKLGMMFLGTHTGNQPWDMRATLSDITDGASNTLMVGENILVGYSQDSPYAAGLETNWACPLPNFAMFLGSDDVCRSDRSPSDCLGGQLRRGQAGRDGPGWARANQWGTFEEIDFGQNLTVEGSFPFANSSHPPHRDGSRGGNFGFCDGAVRYISATIDGTVYAKIITPGGSKLPAPMRQGAISQDDYAQ